MRTKRALLNTAVAFGSKALLLVSGFLLQQLMSRVLGQQNIGLGSVCANVVSILSLAELGFSTAIVYNLYGPLAKRDAASVRALMALFSKVYRVVAVVVAVLGLLLMPVVPAFLKGGNFTPSYVRGIYGLFLLKTVLSYCFASRRSLLLADQKTYQISLVDLVTQMTSLLGGIVALRLTGSYASYLVLCAAMTFAANLATSYLARRQYPDLWRNTVDMALQHQIEKEVRSNIKNVFLTRLSNVVLSSTDALIVSSFVGVMAAGAYANYTLMTLSALGLICAMTEALQPTLGHMMTTETGAHMDGVLKSDTFLYYLIGAGAGLCMMCASSVFVGEIWLNPSYLLPSSVVILLMSSFFQSTLFQPLKSMLNVSGLFAKERVIAISGAACNLILSLALVGPIGIAGVIVGTLISQGLQAALKIRLLYKVALRVPARGFVLQLCSYFLLFAAQTGLCWWLCDLLSASNPWLLLVLRAATCLGVIATVNLPLWLWTKRAAALKFSLKQALGRKVEVA